MTSPKANNALDALVYVDRLEELFLQTVPYFPSNRERKIAVERFMETTFWLNQSLLGEDQP